MSLHVECGGLITDPHGRVTAPIENGSALRWSETVATAGTTTNAVPVEGNPLVLTLTAQVDMWVAIGVSPSAAANPRRRLTAGIPRSFWAAAGDRVAWVAV